MRTHTDTDTPQTHIWHYTLTLARPGELQTMVISFLSPVEVASTACVSKNWRALIDDDLLWRGACWVHCHVCCGVCVCVLCC